MEAEEATFDAMSQPLQSTDPVLYNKLIAGMTSEETAVPFPYRK